MRLTVDPNTQETVISMENKEFSEFQHGLRTMWHFLSAEVMRNIQRYNLAQNVSREANPVLGGVVPSEELSNRVRAVEAIIGDQAWLDEQDEGTSILAVLQELMTPEAVAKRRPYQALTQRVIDAEEDIKRLREDLDRMMQDYVTDQGFEDLITRVRRLEAQEMSVPKAGGLFATDEFSPPIGGQVETAEDRATVALRSAYERGLRAGADKALKTSKQHVRDYMSGAFSEGTIQGVVKAMDGYR